VPKPCKGVVERCGGEIRRKWEPKGLLEVGAARDQIYLPFDDGIKQIDRK